MVVEGGEYERQRLPELEMSDLAPGYYDLRRRLLWRWQAPIANDFLTALFFGVLRRLITCYGLDGPGMPGDLLCGEAGLLSTGPAGSVMRMAATIREDKSLLGLFERTPDGDPCQCPPDEPNHGPLAVQFRGHLKTYGHRCDHELKLEEPSLRDEPASLLAIIRSYLPRRELDLDPRPRQELGVRRRAEEQVRLRLKGRRPSFLAPRYLLFRW